MITMDAVCVREMPVWNLHVGKAAMRMHMAEEEPV